MSITIAAISGVVAAAVKYLLQSKGLEAAGQKAAENIGELGGAKLAAVGQNVLAKLREALGQRGDAARKAQRALADVEDDPADPDYQRKLSAELDKLATTDTELRTLLERLSAEVQQVGGGSRSHTQTIGNNAQIGAAIAGNNSGTVTTTFNNQRTITTGGSYVEGGVKTGGGDFIGGNKTVHGDEVRGNKIGSQRTINTAGGDYSEGSIDTRTGNDGTFHNPVVESGSGGTGNIGSGSAVAPPASGQTRSGPGTTRATDATSAPPASEAVPSAAVTGVPAAPPAAPAPRTRHLVARFPERLAAGARVPLQVRVARSANAPSTNEQASVTITVFSAGLALTSEATRTVALPPDADSDWVPFELEASQPGPHTIDITAFVGGAFLGTLSLAVTVDSSTPTGPFVEHSSAVAVRAPAAGEVTLAIRYDRTTQQYRFQLRSATLGELDEITSPPLLTTPESVVNKVAGLLNAQARNLTKFSPREARDWLKGLGTYLWKELIPKELNDIFWQYQPSISRLTILSAGDPVPWELCYPFSQGQRRDAGFLAEQFLVTRWLFGPPPPDKLRGDRPVFVQPTNAPPTAEAEIAALQQLFGAGQIIRELTPLLDLLHSGDFSTLHFAAHNVHQAEHLTSSYVRLGDRHFEQTFVDPSLQGTLRGPLVFMNACRSDGMAPGYTSLTGWAQAFITAGAGAFIGSLWEVRDQTAARFAQALYQALLGGSTLGEAMTAARKAIQTDPSDPTWLAYTLYGNPSATVTTEASHG